MRPKLSLRIPKHPDQQSRVFYVVAAAIQVLVFIVLARVLTVPIINLFRTGTDFPEERISPVQLQQPPPVTDSAPQPQQRPPESKEARVPPPVSPVPPPVTPPPTIAPPVVPPVVPPSRPPVPPAGVGDTDRRVLGRGLIPQLSPRPPRRGLLGVDPPKGPLTDMPRARTPDSIATVWIAQYWDSVARAQALAAGRRDPTDWTTRRGDNTYGMDSKFIYFGKFRLPTMLLALLPINMQTNPTAMQRNRVLDQLRADIMYHANRAQSQADFDAAVKALRERKERERQEAERRKKVMGGK
jgi:hypothetical protein